MTSVYSEYIHAERNRERSILETYASRTTPELLETERRLQCYVEGIERDKILLRFTHIDKADVDREFSVVIDVTSNVYKGELPLRFILVPCLMRCSAYYVARTPDAPHTP